MFRNYLKLALRQYRRNRATTVINILGLSVGIACCLLILLWVQDETSYDEFHGQADRIYRVVNDRHPEPAPTTPDPDQIHTRAATPPAMGPTLESEFPEVVSSTRFYYVGRTLVQRAEKQIFEPHILITDSTVFNLFSIDLLRGDPVSALREPSTMVISRSAADRFFPDEDPMGQTLEVWGDWTITGVFEDLPEQSTIEADYLLSFSSMANFVNDPSRLENWIWQQFYTYVLLEDGTDVVALEAKLPAFIERYADAETKSFGFSYQTHLQPLADVYLKSAGLRYDAGPRGNHAYVVSLSLIAVLILLIACFNFMNLSTARSMQRAKEIGMRKAIGAGRAQLIRQFLGESSLLAAFSVAVGALIAAAALPAFNTFVEKSLTLNPFDQPDLVVALVAGALIVGLFAGSYPALYLSSFRPVSVLKGLATDSGGMTAVRKGLVVFQFATTTVLIVATLVILAQIRYIQSKDLGFTSEQLVVLPLRGDMDENLDAVKSEITRHPDIEAATAHWGVPGSWSAGDGIRLPGSDARWPTNMLTVDFEFLDTYEMQTIAGRPFSADFPSDVTSAFMLSRTAARELGWTPEEALGREILWDEWGADTLRKGQVVGVIDDFHVATLHEEIQPMVLIMQERSAGQLSVRIKPDRVEESLAHIEAVFATWVPDRPFEYEFLDDDLGEEYAGERKLSTIVSIFALLAIVVACLGLFGLSSYTAERRTKEIGVRKVLGASLASVVGLLTGEFARLVAIAFGIGAPLAWFAARQWLESFAYRVDLGFDAFALAGFVILAVAMATVAFQAIRAATIDPVRSLKSE